MSTVCSRCSHVYDYADACPRCGAESPARGEPGAAPSRGPRWQQTAWGRILIGLILAQGLFYGIRHLATGVLLAASGGDAEALWSDLRNVMILQGIQLFGVLAGALIAGGGQRSGVVLGAVVGAWNGVLAVMLRQNPSQELTMVGLYGQPVLHTALGAVGGLIGSLIWRPIPAAAVPLILAPPRKPVPRRKSNLLAGKIHWIRVLVGATLAVVGTLSATLILQKVLDLSQGKLTTTSDLQDRLITWEIKLLALIVGGVLAGATTKNGLKQGLVVGFASGVALVGFQAPTTDRWLEIALFTLVGTTCLCSVGGWFGGNLFPPLLKLDHRRVGSFV